MSLSTTAISPDNSHYWLAGHYYARRRRRGRAPHVPLPRFPPPHVLRFHYHFQLVISLIFFIGRLLTLFFHGRHIILFSLEFIIDYAILLLHFFISFSFSDFIFHTLFHYSLSIFFCFFDFFTPSLPPYYFADFSHFLSPHDYHDFHFFAVSLADFSSLLPFSFSLYCCFHFSLLASGCSILAISTIILPPFSRHYCHFSLLSFRCKAAAFRYRRDFQRFSDAAAAFCRRFLLLLPPALPLASASGRFRFRSGYYFHFFCCHFFMPCFHLPPLLLSLIFVIFFFFFFHLFSFFIIAIFSLFSPLFSYHFITLFIIRCFHFIFEMPLRLLFAFSFSFAILLLLFIVTADFLRLISRSFIFFSSLSRRFHLFSGHYAFTLLPLAHFFDSAAIFLLFFLSIFRFFAAFEGHFAFAFLSSGCLHAISLHYAFHCRLYFSRWSLLLLCFSLLVGFWLLLAFIYAIICFLFTASFDISPRRRDASALSLLPLIAIWCRFAPPRASFAALLFFFFSSSAFFASTFSLICRHVFMLSPADYFLSIDIDSFHWYFHHFTFRRRLFLPLHFTPLIFWYADYLLLDWSISFQIFIFWYFSDTLPDFFISLLYAYSAGFSLIADYDSCIISIRWFH